MARQFIGRTADLSSSGGGILLMVARCGVPGRGGGEKRGSRKISLDGTCRGARRYGGGLPSKDLGKRRGIQLY